MKLLRLFTVVLASSALVALSGCTRIVSATTDQPIESDPTSRSFGSMIDDSLIETTATVNIRKADPGLDHAHLVVVSYNGVLLLAGQVPSEELRHRAAQTAAMVKNVKRVHNQLTAGPNTSLVIRSSDSLITSKIKGKFVSHGEMNSSRTKVVTENGVVYLMGLVTESQADLAGIIAQQTGGVQKVVRLFEYVAN